MKKNKSSKKVAIVLFGGKSVEHDISIITGVQTANAVNKSKFDVVPIYISKEGKWFTSIKFFNIKTFSGDVNLLSKDCKQVVLSNFDKFLYIVSGSKLKKWLKVDFAFLANHGGNGENGVLQGYLETCNITYSSSGTLGSASCMNKIATKLILSSIGIPLTKYIAINQLEYRLDLNKILEKIEKLGYPVIVKPCSLGSSIGINFCKNAESVKNALSFAFLFDTEVVVEEAVQNLKEVNLAVVGNFLNIETSNIEEVIKEKDFLTFENKYLNSNSSAKGMENTRRKIPAQLTKKQEQEILEYGKKAFLALGCKGVVRIDFLINEQTEEVFLNEINTIPGSLANYLWQTKEYSFSILLDKVFEYAVEEEEEKSKKIKNFSSNVLSQFKNASKLEVKK